MVITENFIISTIHDLNFCEVYEDGITFNELVDELENTFLFESDTIDSIKNYKDKIKKLKVIIQKLKQNYVILIEDEKMYINTNSEEFFRIKKIKDEIIDMQITNMKKPSLFKNILSEVKSIYSYIFT